MTGLNLKASPFRIGADEDWLKRAEVFLPLTASLASVQTPYVLALDGPWGCGKTTFLKMWQSHLQSPDCGLNCVYFDAWKSDFYGDALPALIAETERELNPESKSELAEAGRKLGEFGDMVTSRQFITRVFGSLAESVPGGKVVKDSVQAALESLEPHNAVRNYLNYREAVDEFKKSLGDFVKEKKGNKPLFFFIDELDRCRPIFAIEVLEKVKHVFDAEGVVFVVGVHKTALAKTVEKIYGYDDGEIYLRKFFDDTHTLINARSIVHSVASRLDTSGMKPSALEFYKNYLSDLSETLGLSLRDTERFTSRILPQSKFHGDKGIISYVAPYLMTIEYYNLPLHQKIVESKDNLSSFPFEEAIAPLLNVMEKLQKTPGGWRNDAENACGILGHCGCLLSGDFRAHFDRQKKNNPDDPMVKITEIMSDHYRQNGSLEHPHEIERLIRQIIERFLLR